MFFRNMEQVSVEVNEETLWIRIVQVDPRDRNNDSIIEITPDQVDGVINWLQEAKTYIAGLSSKE